MSILIKNMEIPDIEKNKSKKAEIRNLNGKLELGIMTGGYYYSQQWSYYPIEVPKQGTWIAGEDGHYQCSVCGHIVDKVYTCSDLSRLGYYCRNCGAEMDGMLF